MIMPELATCGATSAARPACLTVMVPWLSIFAFGLLPAWSNFMTPAMKFWLRDVGGADHHAGGVDLRALVEVHARLVHQDELTVGVDAPGDL